MLLHYAVEGFRLLAEERAFAEWAYVGKAFSNLFLSIGLEASADSLFHVFWFMHLLVIFGFGIYILYSNNILCFYRLNGQI